jgi:membrane-associated phospholipid phosphatase
MTAVRPAGIDPEQHEHAEPAPPPLRRGIPLGWAVGLAVVGYVVVLSAFMLAGYRAFVWKTPLVPVLLLVALVGRRFRTFIQDWIVFLASVVLLDAIRGFIFATIVVGKRTVHWEYVVRWEEALFGWPALGLPIQRWAEATGASAWLTPLAVPIHASHFAFFLLFGLALWAYDRRAHARWVFVMLVMMAAGLACYALVPTAPPWMASAQRRIPYLAYIAGQAYNAKIPTLQTIFATNPVAAMPSLHIAFPTVCALAAWRAWRWRGALAWIYVALMAFALMYLAEHYAVDILAGWLLGMTAWALAVRAMPVQRWIDDFGWSRWSPSRHFTAAMVIVLAAVLISSWSTVLLPGLPF